MAINAEKLNATANRSTAGKGFIQEQDYPPLSQTEPTSADSNHVVGAYKIDAMREGAIALSATSHEAMSAL